MWRNAWIDGDAIVMNCPFEELKAHHLEDLKADVTAPTLKRLLWVDCIAAAVVGVSVIALSGRLSRREAEIWLIGLHDVTQR